MMSSRIMPTMSRYRSHSQGRHLVLNFAPVAVPDIEVEIGRSPYIDQDGLRSLRGRLGRKQGTSYIRAAGAWSQSRGRRRCHPLARPGAWCRPRPAARGDLAVRARPGKDRARRGSDRVPRGPDQVRHRQGHRARASIVALIATTLLGRTAHLGSSPQARRTWYPRRYSQFSRDRHTLR